MIETVKDEVEPALSLGFGFSTGAYVTKRDGVSSLKRWA